MLISRWLARHIGNAELERGLAESDRNALAPGQLEAVDELAEHLRTVVPGERGELEMIARETLEALALGPDLAFPRCSRESSASAGASPRCEQEPEGLRLEIDAPETASQLGIGDSVSVSGACLTATAVSNGSFSVTAVRRDAEPHDARPTRSRRRGQPRDRAARGRPARRPLRPGPRRRASAASPRSARTARVWVEAAPEILRYCVEKGSIAVDGVSLTIAGLRDDAFEVALIPHTLEVTTLGALEPGDEVNLEVDVLAKYVEKLIAPGYDFGPMTQTAHEKTRHFAAIEDAIEDIRQGKFVVVVDAADRENEGDLTIAAQFATPEAINFMATHARGLICLPLTEERCDELGSAPDGRAQRGAAPDRLHRLDRGARRRLDRDLRAGPLAHDPGRDRPDEGAGRPRPARPRLPAARTRRRRPQARRPDGSRGRPRAARGPQPGRRRLRGDEGGRDDGARPRPRRVLRAPRASS